MNKIKIFYQNLYKNVDHELENINIQSMLSSPSVHIPCLDDKVSKTLDEHISEKDVLQVLKK